MFFNISIKILAKYILFKNQDKSSRNDFKKYIIYGAGRTGVELKKIIQNYGDIEILYFVDDDKNKIGRTIDGIKVLSPKALEKEKKKIDLVLMFVSASFEFKY